MILNETEVSPKLVLTVEQLAVELGIGRNSAYELVCREDFPSFRIGKKILIDYDGLKHWIRNQWQPSRDKRYLDLGA